MPSGSPKLKRSTRLPTTSDGFFGASSSVEPRIGSVGPRERRLRDDARLVSDKA